MKDVLQKIWEWIKKNKQYVILAALILTAVIWISIREAVIKHQQKKIDELEFANFNLDKDRQYLELELGNLQSEYKAIQKSNDSLKLALKAKQRQLSDLIKKHEHIIDSLTNIPADSAYSRLQAIYPNFDNSDLKFPFSGSQVSPIYRTAVSYPLLKQEFDLQGKTLSSCLTLNSGFELQIGNLNAQVGNFTQQIGKCDERVGNYQKEVKILNRKVKNRGFWSKTLLTTTLVATGIAILR